jgi:hypothetical protein
VGKVCPTILMPIVGSRRLAIWRCTCLHLQVMARFDRVRRFPAPVWTDARQGA